MGSRELFNCVMQALDSHGRQLSAISEKQSRLDTRIDALRPQSYLPMIARPTQGVDYARTCNVAEYVDKKVKEYNENVNLSAPRYLEFAQGRTHDDLNRSALATIGGIMVRKLGDHYGGEKTWEKLYRKMPQACEDILEEARLRPELAVFAQVDGQWCLRELAKNKLKSFVRSQRSQATATAQAEHANHHSNVPQISLEGEEAHAHTETGQTNRQVVQAEVLTGNPNVRLETGNEISIRGNEVGPDDNTHDESGLEQQNIGNRGSSNGPFVSDIPPAQDSRETENMPLNRSLSNMTALTQTTRNAKGPGYTANHVNRGNPTSRARRTPRSGLSSRNVRGRKTS